MRVLMEILVIQDAAKRMNGATGPSGMDSDGWRRILSNQIKS